MLATQYRLRSRITKSVIELLNVRSGVHIVAQRANRYIVAFRIAISRYRVIFTYQVAVVKLKDFRRPAVM